MEDVPESESNLWNIITEKLNELWQEQKKEHKNEREEHRALTLTRAEKTYENKFNKQIIETKH